MDSEHLEVVPIHKYPQYLRPCCELINNEWPRSETARMMSLQASCDELPTNLILINKEKHILGHCKLTPIPSMPLSCFIESVVISRLMRGQKLGTFLMKQVEKYCKDVLKLEMIHLSTKGQEDFYAKLGYEVCAPVSIYGSSISYSTGASSSKTIPVPIRNIDKCVALVDVDNNAPPPPPMPKPQNVVNTLKSNRTYMFKNLV
ncbi:N-alpha-acetyltransferase 80 [Maniola hyperantus]|uniref:N-alpha-acetyltransferase 80 n=1 Tax=Aphantopus hyperantus TaxID=2795564 RepID=UPI00156964DA|nr:N-alpha-acetyltransferase 80 [Maniola hyperantus]